MKTLFLAVAASVVIAGCSNTKQSSMNSNSNNTASANETGFVALFDGKTTTGWHTYGKQGIGKAWKVADGALYLDAAAKKDWQTAEGGDIVTDAEFDNFHLKLDWKVAPGGNSGVIFYINEDLSKYQYPWQTGPEMQVLDNAAHNDAKIIKHRAGDLYDLITAKETVKPAGEWNSAEIIANNGNLQFFLNGQQTLQTTMWDDAWRHMVAGSKFKSMPDFGTYKKGRIALQDHGDNVWFRNIRIKRL